MIHKFRVAKQNFVLDVNTSYVYMLDDLAYDLIDANEKTISLLKTKYKKKEITIDECLKEFQKLKNEGKLFSKSNDKEILNFTENLPIKSMCLNVAHDCNLRCGYCFASTGNFGTKRCLMSFEVGKKAIDFLIKKSKKRYNLEVDFFGGEPLMNFDVIKKIIKYARSIESFYNKNFRFTITTNGILLDDEKIDFINKEMFNVVLSLDGRKNINDNFRVTAKNQGSYDKIVPFYQKLVNKRSCEKNYYIRGTFTKNNLDFTEDVLHMVDLGFKNISIEPVISDKNKPYSIKEENLKKIGEEYEKLLNIMLKRDGKENSFNFFHLMINLDGGPCFVKRVRGCSCGNEYVAITPEGDIYPCHQFVGENKWKMGNLLKENFDGNIKETFLKININSKKKCKTCFAKYYCSGGCIANSWTYEKNLFKPYEISCKIQKKRLECAIALQSFKKMKKCSVFRKI